MKSFSRIPLTLLLLLFVLPLLGAGCKASNQSFPPKPPIPGIQRSPAIDRISP